MKVNTFLLRGMYSVITWYNTPQMKDNDMKLTHLNILVKDTLYIEVLLTNQKLAAIQDRILTDIWSRFQNKVTVIPKPKIF